jgi:hypothetical protein
MPLYLSFEVIPWEFSYFVHPRCTFGSSIKRTLRQYVVPQCAGHRRKTEGRIITSRITLFQKRSPLARAFRQAPADKEGVAFLFEKHAADDCIGPARQVYVDLHMTR